MSARYEIRRVGKRHQYEVYVSGRFFALVGRALFQKNKGATWLVTLKPGAGVVPAKFSDRASALDAALRRAGVS